MTVIDRRRVLVLGAMTAAAAGTVSAAPLDPMAGVWVLNVAASRGAVGTQTLTISVRGQEETYLSEWLRPDGLRIVTGHVVTYDGAPATSHSFSVGPDGEVTAITTRVSMHRLAGQVSEVTFWRGDQVARTLLRQSAEDGRVLVTTMFDGAAGKDATPTARLVFDRR